MITKKKIRLLTGVLGLSKERIEEVFTLHLNKVFRLHSVSCLEALCLAIKGYKCSILYCVLTFVQLEGASLWIAVSIIMGSVEF